MSIKIEKSRADGMISNRWVNESGERCEKYQKVDIFNKQSVLQVMLRHSTDDFKKAINNGTDIKLAISIYSESNTDKTSIGISVHDEGEDEFDYPKLKFDILLEDFIELLLDNDNKLNKLESKHRRVLREVHDG